jgi:hypothetical protein
MSAHGDTRKHVDQNLHVYVGVLVKKSSSDGSGAQGNPILLGYKKFTILRTRPAFTSVYPAILPKIGAFNVTVTGKNFPVHFTKAALNAKCLLYGNSKDMAGGGGADSSTTEFLERVFDAVVISSEKLVCLIDMVYDFSNAQKYAVSTGQLPDHAHFKFTFHSKLDYVFSPPKTVTSVPGSSVVDTWTALNVSFIPAPEIEAWSPAFVMVQNIMYREKNTPGEDLVLIKMHQGKGAGKHDASQNQRGPGGVLVAEDSKSKSFGDAYFNQYSRQWWCGWGKRNEEVDRSRVGKFFNYNGTHF